MRTWLSSLSRASPTRARQDRRREGTAILRLYGRRDCHLCEEMAQALRARGVPFAEIDVDADEALEGLYGDRVPVLTDATGGEICFGRLDVAALQARLAVR